jgi:hypothetical protein
VKVKSVGEDQEVLKSGGENQVVIKRGGEIKCWKRKGEDQGGREERRGEDSEGS